METEERPSKVRKLSHDAGDVEQSTENLSELEQAVSKQNEEASSKDEISDDQSDADTAETSGDGVSVRKFRPTRPVDMSKNAWKKIQKKAEWEAGREFRKAKRKEKIQAKKARDRAAKAKARELRDAQPPTDQLGPARQVKRHVKMPVTFLIDCSMDDLMMEKERISLGSQLTRTYADNTRALFQAHLMISSWGGLLKERFDTILQKHYENWRGVVFTDKDFVEAATLADTAMRDQHGEEMLERLAQYRSVGQPDLKVKRLNRLLKQTSHGLDSTVQTKDLEPANSAVLLRDQIDAVADESEAAQCGTSPRTELNNGDLLPSPRSIPHTTSSPEKIEQPQQNNDMTDSSNSSAPANGQHSLGGFIQPSPQSNIPKHEQGEVIYLTSDSPHTLEVLKPFSTYIIGGLVDKNRHKGICYKTACERGLETAKLPIGEFMEMRSRFVLATNHVVEIMLRWLECGDWGQAFLDVIPKRKGGKLKESDAVGESVEPDNESQSESA